MIRYRSYGNPGGSTVIALHGGPAAVGEAAPIAGGLAGSFRVIEPWQRGSGGQPLTVARHVADLRELVGQLCPAASPPALVGESWGAMLALAYAAAHPDLAGPLVLVGCGTFDPEARARLHAILEERGDDDLRRRLQQLAGEIDDEQSRLRKTYELTQCLSDFDAIETTDPSFSEAPSGPFDVQAHLETWQDMLRLQEEGVYPAAFAAITSPVLMLHGDHDPHPGAMIRDSLIPYLPQLEYHELARCGHSPWRERHARDEFFAVLRAWLGQRHSSASKTRDG